MSLSGNTFQLGLMQLQMKRLDQLGSYWRQHLFYLERTNQKVIPYSGINLLLMQEFSELSDKYAANLKTLGKTIPLTDVNKDMPKILSIVKAAWVSYLKRQELNKAKEEGAAAWKLLESHNAR